MPHMPLTPSTAGSRETLGSTDEGVQEANGQSGDKGRQGVHEDAHLSAAAVEY